MKTAPFANGAKSAGRGNQVYSGGGSRHGYEIMSGSFPIARYRMLIEMRTPG
jgi:hypothetical protein